LFENLPVKRKIASRESEKRKNSTTAPSVLAVIAMTGAATSGQCNAIFAKDLAGNFHHIEAPASLARGVFICIDCRF
jgi:hypothetical protein